MSRPPASAAPPKTYTPALNLPPNMSDAQKAQANAQFQQEIARVNARREAEFEVADKAHAAKNAGH